MRFFFAIFLWTLPPDSLTNNHIFIFRKSFLPLRNKWRSLNHILVLKSLFNKISILTLVVRTWRSHKLNIIFSYIFTWFRVHFWCGIVDRLNCFIWKMNLRGSWMLPWVKNVWRIFHVNWIFSGWDALSTRGLFGRLIIFIDTSFGYNLFFERTHSFALLWLICLPLRTDPWTIYPTWSFLLAWLSWFIDVFGGLPFLELLTNGLSNIHDIWTLLFVQKILFASQLLIFILIIHLNISTFNKKWLFIGWWWTFTPSIRWYLNFFVNIMIKFCWCFLEKLSHKTVL